MLLGQIKHTTLKQLRIFHPESLCTDAHRFLFTSVFNCKLRLQLLYFLLPPVQSTALSASVSDVVQHPVGARHNRAQGLPPLSVLQKKIQLLTLEEKFQCVCVCVFRLHFDSLSKVIIQPIITRNQFLR